MKEIVRAGIDMSGRVTGRWLNLRTGETVPAFEHRNQLTYGAADVMAQLLAGATDYAPKFMGFIYGDSYSVPASLVDHTYRGHTWESIGTELADVHGNMQIAPISLTPTLSVDGDAGLYAGNAVTLTAHTSAGGTCGFPLVSPYAGALDTGYYLYHVVLLTRRTASQGFIYTPVARASLADSGPVYQTKPDGFELAVDWQITFA